MGNLVLHYTIISTQKLSWKRSNKKWGPNRANLHLAELLYSMQLKEPSFFLPLLGSGHQAVTWRDANSTHHWLPFQQMRNLPKYGTEWGENGSKSRADQEKSAFTFCIAEVLGGERWEGPPDLLWDGSGEHGTLEWHYRRKEQTAGSSRKFSFRRFMSRGVQKPSEEPLELQICVRRSLFPPSSPAWACWAGARTFWCLALIYLFDEK